MTRERSGSATSPSLKLATAVVVSAVAIMALVLVIETSSGAPMEQSGVDRTNRETQLRNLGVPEDEWELDEESDMLPQVFGEKAPLQVVELVMRDDALG